MNFLVFYAENYIDAVIGPQSYHEVNKIITDIERKNSRLSSTEFDVIEKFDCLNLLKNSVSKISSFLTIQEGCDKFCKFCVVPYTRGPEFSRSVKEIVSEARQLIENGSKDKTRDILNIKKLLEQSDQPIAMSRDHKIAWDSS